MKYGHILDKLDDNVLYTPALIAHFARDNKLIPPDEDGAYRICVQRIRITMGRMSNNHRFPDEGDGTVTLTGQVPTPAWYGWRWKNVPRTIPKREK